MSEQRNNHENPLILTFSHQGRRNLTTPSPLMGEGWGEGGFLSITF